MAIKNVVFDFGQVMARYEPAYMTGQYVTDAADAALVAEVVFDRLYWDKLDDGTITDEEVLAGCQERLPERLWEIAEMVYRNWIYHLPPVEGMAELVNYLRQRYGVGLYLLSNISCYFAAHREELPALSLFDGCVLSGPIGLVKPNKAIYAYLCDTYRLHPQETLFIDDSPVNIAGAESYGIHGYLFDGDAGRLRAYLDTLLE